jgi:hypothetical protein
MLLNPSERSVSWTHLLKKSVGYLIVGVVKRSVLSRSLYSAFDHLSATVILHVYVWLNNLDRSDIETYAVHSGYKERTSDHYLAGIQSYSVCEKARFQTLGLQNHSLFVDVVSIARIGTMHAWGTKLHAGGKSDLRIAPV